MIGRLVDSTKELEHEGDYALVRTPEGEITSLWMILPRTKTRGRIAAEGFGSDGREWRIVEEAGRVTVEPSIAERVEGGYHGFLRNGIWSDA